MSILLVTFERTKNTYIIYQYSRATVVSRLCKPIDLISFKRTAKCQEGWEGLESKQFAQVRCLWEDLSRQEQDNIYGEEEF